MEEGALDIARADDDAVSLIDDVGEGRDGVIDGGFFRIL